MKVNTISEIGNFLYSNFDSYLDNVRGDNPNVFTRNRKVGPLPLLLQMFTQKGKTQFSELVDYYKEIDKPLDISTVGFYKARMNFNPEAIKLMSNDFIYQHYENYRETLVKLNGYYITAIDGSDIILPSTKENKENFGVGLGGKDSNINDCPAMGSISTLYDCINKLILDIEIQKYKYSEKDMAANHITELKKRNIGKTITIFDRGYFSFKLVNSMIENNQKFLFRLRNDHLKRYHEQLKCNEADISDVKLTRENLRYYREEPELFNKLSSTTYKLRFAKILVTDNGANTEEILLTNLTEDEFDINGLKELYHLRWDIETAYNCLKNRMKIEEFSGYRSQLIKQDIYSCVWLYNLVNLFVIEANLKSELPQDRYTYKMKRNNNQSIGIVKSYFLRSLMFYESPERFKELDIVNMIIKTTLIPVKNKRKVKRGNSKNKSRMSYRYTY